MKITNNIKTIQNLVWFEFKYSISEEIALKISERANVLIRNGTKISEAVWQAIEIEIDRIAEIE